MKLRNMYLIGIGILFVISGVIACVANSGDAVLRACLFTAGAAFLATGIVRHRIYGDDPESDERSKKIGWYGLSYAWLTGTVGITLLFWAEYAGILRLTAQNALAVSILLLAFSAILFQVYFFRKGDVE